jgi:hypothetical protein
MVPYGSTIGMHFLQINPSLQVKHLILEHEYLFTLLYVSIQMQQEIVSIIAFIVVS